MTADEFLKKLLESQELTTEQLKSLTSHREEVEEYLRDKYGQEPTIRYAGSKAKGTMIAESYDLDLTCYFPSSNESTLKELHDSVEKLLGKKYSIERKASAVRIKQISNQIETDYHIDVVPGRFVDGNDGDVFLHVSYGEKERMQTNIDTHISFVKDSGCQEIIKLLKLWKVRNKLSFKTLLLEIYVVEHLKGSKTKSELAKSVRSVLQGMSEEIENVKLVDPANSNNIVTEALTDADKTFIAGRAAAALTILEENEDDEVLAWKKIFDEETKAGRWTAPTVITAPAKPWCQL